VLQSTETNRIQLPICRRTDFIKIVGHDDLTKTYQNETTNASQARSLDVFRRAAQAFLLIIASVCE
jgi:hypothetical protein